MTTLIIIIIIGDTGDAGSMNRKIQILKRVTSQKEAGMIAQISDNTLTGHVREYDSLRDPYFVLPRSVLMR